MNRRATTLLEALIAVTLGLLVLGALACVSQLAASSSRAGAQSGALAEAALVLATLERDLTQALPGTAVQFSQGSLALAVARRAADGTLASDRVVYTKVDAGRGLYRLRRTVSGRAWPLPGTFRAIHIAQWNAAGGPFIRATLASEDVVLGSLIRVSADPSVNTIRLK